MFHVHRQQFETKQNKVKVTRMESGLLEMTGAKVSREIITRRCAPGQRGEIKRKQISKWPDSGKITDIIF